MTTIHLLALIAYFLILTEYIAMRHRVICAESDVRMKQTFADDGFFGGWPNGLFVRLAALLYWNRGTK